MTVQTRSFRFDRTLILNALYDVTDQIGAKLLSGDSMMGNFKIKMPDGYGEVSVQVTGSNPCEIAITAGSDTSPKFGYEQENWAIQYLFSQLEILLAGLK